MDQEPPTFAKFVCGIMDVILVYVLAFPKLETQLWRSLADSLQNLSLGFIPSHQERNQLGLSAIARNCKVKD